MTRRQGRYVPVLNRRSWTLPLRPVLPRCDPACGAEAFGSCEQAWLSANAPGHDWVNPTWAGPTGNKPEPWHREYVPGEQG